MTDPGMLIANIMAKANGTYDPAAPPMPITSIEPPWPELKPAALAGLAGEIVSALSPYTESDDVATLATFLILFGGACNRAPFVYAGEDRHGTNLFGVLVGASSKARKGTSLGGPRRLVGGTDQVFVRDRFVDGLSSGEGLIWQVRDAVIKTDKKGNEFVEVEGVDDKRLVCIEEEFASFLTVAERQGNTLSPVVRRAWDARGILASTTKNSPAKATNPHICILGHITRDELRRTLTDTAIANGLGNRFLWFLVKRSKALPNPGRLPDDDARAMSRAIGHALDSARTTSEIAQDRKARAHWSDIYEALSDAKPGLAGALMARGEAQVLRLSLLYALLDGAGAIELEHLESALALWDYCEASIRHVFNDVTGNPNADRILVALRASGRMSQSQVSELFGRNLSAARISTALESLLSGKLARIVYEQGLNGRPITYWEAA